MMGALIRLAMMVDGSRHGHRPDRYNPAIVSNDADRLILRASVPPGPATAAVAIAGVDVLSGGGLRGLGICPIHADQTHSNVTNPTDITR